LSMRPFPWLSPIKQDPKSALRPATSSASAWCSARYFLLSVQNPRIFRSSVHILAVFCPARWGHHVAIMESGRQSVVHNLILSLSLTHSHTHTHTYHLHVRFHVPLASGCSGHRAALSPALIAIRSASAIRSVEAASSCKTRFPHEKLNKGWQFINLMHSVEVASFCKKSDTKTPKGPPCQSVHGCR
jgi:hypothetical protein